MSAPDQELRNSLDDAARRRELRLEIEEFNTAYAHVLDRGDMDAWPGFFHRDAIYRVTGRENYDAGLRVGLVYCDGLGMIRDRALAVESTMVFEPRYLRHYNSNVRVTGVHDDGAILAESNYLVVESLMEDETRIFQAGCYLDRFVRENGRLLLLGRDCIYDSLIIPNAMVYPV